MAGHNKFSKIKRKKEVQDIKRGKMFTKILREITVAVKGGKSTDPKSNPRLRIAILAAKESNLPKVKIEDAIKKASSPTDTSNFSEMKYEGYASSGVALIVEALTNNKTRTVQALRTIFSKHGGSLGDTGCVSYLFKYSGFITFPSKVKTLDEMLELAIDAGAEDCQLVDDEFEILSDYDKLHSVKDYLEKSLGEASAARLIWKPNSTVTLDNEKTSRVLKLIDTLEDMDDVQRVFSNLEIPDGFDIDSV